MSQQEENTESNRTREWKLEESSLWWLGLDIWKNPGNVLLLSSVPFCAGAYFGYKKPSEKLEKLAGAGKKMTEEEMGTLAERRMLGMQTAARALRLGTLGSVGTFGMLGAALFYGFGYRSVDEALNRTSIWATSWRESFEGFLGMEDRPSKTHPEVIATKHMNEEEELNYLYENYIKEPEDNTQQQDLYQNETKK